MSTKKTTKKTKASEKKLKVKEMSQTHGMVEGKKYEPTTLDQVWGDDGLSKYQTMDAAEYESKVENMPLADLKEEAIRVGLLPVDNAEMLKERLLRQFNVHISSYRKPVENPQQAHKVSPEINKILKEGR